MLNFTFVRFAIFQRTRELYGLHKNACTNSIGIFITWRWSIWDNVLQIGEYLLNTVYFACLYKAASYTAHTKTTITTAADVEGGGGGKDRSFVNTRWIDGLEVVRFNPCRLHVWRSLCVFAPICNQKAKTAQQQQLLHRYELVHLFRRATAHRICCGDVSACLCAIPPCVWAEIVILNGFGAYQFQQQEIGGGGKCLGIKRLVSALE